MDDAQANLDNIVLPVTFDSLYLPGATVILTVRVTDMVAAGSYITNTASLIATHDMPQGLEVAPTALDDAIVHVGMADRATSYKTATDAVSPSDLIAYELHLINSGDTRLDKITLIDPILVSTTYDSGDLHLVYSDTLNAVLWTGSLAPDVEKVFTFRVEADAGLVVGDMVTNVAAIAWDDNTMDLSATTRSALAPGCQSSTGGDENVSVGLVAVSVSVSQTMRHGPKGP